MKFAETTTAPHSVALNGLAIGSYTLTAVATDDQGFTATSDPVSIQVRAPVTGPIVLDIFEPEDGSAITQPTSIIGTAGGTTFHSYTMQYRRKDDCSTWVTFASGTGQVDGDVLGTLDPTLLINGIYELRLIGTNTSGASLALAKTLVVDGGMKAGHFTVAFNDLTIPLSGLPITITRAYDSREECPGDFGRGWNLDVSSVRWRRATILARNGLMTSSRRRMATRLSFIISPSSTMGRMW